MIHVYLGLKCYKNTKTVNNAEAWQYMTQALAMAPDKLSVVSHVAKFMKKEQHYDKSLKVLLEMLKIAPGSSRLHHEIANNYRWKAMQMNDIHTSGAAGPLHSAFREGCQFKPRLHIPTAGVSTEVCRTKADG